MREDQDAVGRGYLDILNGKEDAEIVIDRDDGHSNVGMDCRNYFADYEDWPALHKKAVEYARGRVLDVGCGAGRHALYLQRKGHEVVGIDDSPLAIQVCKARGLADARVLRFSQIGPKLGTFDTVIMLGNNFGLFASATRAKRLLKRLNAMTSQDARIIAESRDPYQTTEPSHLAYHERNRARGRMGGQVRMRARYAGCTTPWFDYLLASREEMMSLLDGTGWHVAEFIDSDASLYLAVIGRGESG